MEQLLKVSSFIVFMCLSIRATANEVVADVDQFSSTDLTQETVLPKVDYPSTVINKNIKLAHSVDFSLDVVSKTDDLFYDTTSLAFKVAYYWNDDNGIGFQYLKPNDGYNQYAKTFQNSTAQLDFSRAPISKNLMSLYFNQVYFYGKISLANDFVMNQIWLGRYSVGMNQYDTGSSLPFIGAALVVQTFLTRYQYFEIGYGLGVNQIYNPVSQNIRSSAGAVSKQDFSKDFQFSQVLNLSLGSVF